jgi:hypothetical protein
MSHLGCDNRRMTDGTLERIEDYMERGNALLVRIDEHLERGIADTSPEHLARGAEFEARLEAHMTQSTEAIAAAGTSYDEWRFAMRQDSLRNERVLGEISQSLARNTESLDRNTEKTNSFIEESKAYRAALWAILDQLRGEGGPEPAAG